MEIYPGEENHGLRVEKLAYFQRLISDLLAKGEFKDALSISQCAYAIAITAPEREMTIDFIAASFDGLDLATKELLEKNRNWKAFVENIAADYNGLTDNESTETLAEAA